jgi:transposase
MDVVYRAVCGLDLHKRRIVACAITTAATGALQKEVRSFGTMTEDLLTLADWLTGVGVTHVAMERTGVLWKPVYNLLEDQFTLLLANAQHLKTVPGRKTDVKDAEWIAELLRHGLLRPSFVPDRPQRELRELTRYRTSLVQERSAEVNRLQKTLEGANIKLASVASDVLGASGRQMLEALIAGRTDPVALAALAKGKLREKLGDLQRALVGQVGAHQRFLLARQLAHLDFLQDQIEQVSAEIEARLRPFQAALARLDTIPGVGERTAQVLLAEVGADLTRFPSAAHLASWAGLCPGNNESGGKRRSGRTRKGSPWLRAALVEAAHGAARTKDSYLAALYQRLKARRGAKRAAVAVGHAILVIVYYLLSRGESYHDLGPTFLDERHRHAATRRAIRRLERLGYRVTLDPAA